MAKASLKSSLGRISRGFLGDVLQEEKWQLREEFGEKGDEDGQFQFAGGVACLSNGDIAVTDTAKKQLMMFTSTGEFKTSIGQNRLSSPWRVAATPDDLLLVTDEKYVKVFDFSLGFIRQFAPSQNEEDVGTDSWLAGIAVDKENRIAVADIERKVISLHNLDGSLITTIPNDTIDTSWAIGLNERLIFANFFESKLICTTYTGDKVFKVNTSIDGKRVRPLGLCYDDAGNIYVSVCLQGKGGEVHHYSPAGVFIRRVVGGLVSPRGLTFTPSGDLVVVDVFSVNILQRV